MFFFPTYFQKMYNLPPSLVFQINILEADHVVEVGEEAVDVQVVVLVHLVVEYLDALLQLGLLNLFN